MLSPNAITVLEKRYLRKDDAGQPSETPDGMFRRVAAALAEGDRSHGATDAEVRATADKFFTLMWSLDFLPNSPTLANAGTPLGMLSACFVLPVKDDLSSIFDAIKHAALVHQVAGGTGFSFSGLRPKNDIVRSTMGVSSGPVSFMRVFNAATESIKQGGMRRGANMGILRVDHPDILEFIDLKADLVEMTNFNVSVAVTDAFMAAVEAGTAYPLVNPRTGMAAGDLDAREVFTRIVTRAWATGEPGVVFIDRMNRYCPVPWLGAYTATNPCGEMPLLPYESCNLGSINLENFVIYRTARPGEAATRANGTAPAIDWERLRLVVHASMHLLDNVITVNRFPLTELKVMSDATRKVGLGVMGFGRLLFKLGVPYGSEESLVVAEKLMSFIDYESKLASVKLAMARGQFPARDGHEAESNTLYRRWCEERDREEHRHRDCDYALLADLIEKHGIRNSTTTTVAPTGTLSIIAGTSGGCEPVFALAFKRLQADTHMVDADSVFAKALEDAGFPKAAIAEVFAGIEAHHGSLRAYLADGAEGLPGALAAKLDDLAAVFVGAHDILPAEHVHIQAAFQKYNDSSMSKTINAPKDATVEQAMACYQLAWETGCKGVTYYRDGSRDKQPLSTGGTVHEGAGPSEAPAVTLTVSTSPPAGTAPPRRRPEDLYGFTRTTQTGEGKLYTVVNYDEEGLREVVTNVGRSGGTLFSLTEAIGRLISLALQYRVPISEIAKQLIGIRSAAPYGIGPSQVLSIPDAIGRVLESAPRVLVGFSALPGDMCDLAAPAPAQGHHAVEVLGHSPECPECGADLTFGEGCQTCPGCGFSRCG